MGHGHLTTDHNPLDSSSGNTETFRQGKQEVYTVSGMECRWIAFGSKDGTISTFEVARAKFLHHLKGHFMPVPSLVYSSVEPQLLLTASNDAHVDMYDAQGKALVGAMFGHGSWRSTSARTERH